MVTVCLTCGDKGFPEALIYCNQCQVYALHRYCLDGPVIFVDDITWFCEDCEAKVDKPSSLDRVTPLPSGKSDSVNLVKDEIQTRIELKSRVKKSKCKQRKNMKKQKETKDISGFVDKSEEPVSDCRISPHRDQTQCSGPLYDYHSSPQCDQTQCSNNSEECKKFSKHYAPFLGDAANSNEESDSLQTSGLATNDDLNIVKLDCYADAAQPVADPIWRGSLFFRNLSTGAVSVSGLVAHVSSLACSRVLDETRLFPEVLCADLLQRSTVWPKGFKECGPTDQSIALYLFPESERDEKAFDKLVADIISLDLAIRAVVENAELLVFPSTLLPTQFWRFQAKYYLWGVFRGKQASQTKKDTDVSKSSTS